MTESDSEGVFSQTISLLSENGLFANADLSIVSSAEQFKARSFLAQCKATGSKLFKALNESIKASKARITPTPKTKADTAELSRGFLANNNAQLQETIKNADFTQYAKNGIPLEYPRSAFLDDLNVQLANCDEAQAKNILNKLGITINDSKTGYDGFADYTKLDPNNPLEKPIYDITHKFLKENAVVTGDEQLDSALNSLITGFPELLNTVGKQQHAGQAYSVDIHTLKAYQNAISNPEFENLSNLDKTVVKYALLTHDLGKPEDVNDKLHQEVSAEITRTFLECLNLPPQTVDRVVNLVENHHWLEEYSTGTLDPLTASVDFRRADDFLLATIMAEADIGAISVRPNKTYLDSLNASQQPINDAIQQNNQTGTLIYTSTPIRAGEKQGYEVINLNEASEQEMTDFGFVPGTKREDVRFLVHMTSEKTGKTALDTIDELGDDAYLCASYISLDDKATFGMSSEGQRKFGVCLEVENANIGRANSIDQYSGHMQNYDGFVENVQKRSKNQALPKSIKTELSLTDDEYAQLYSQISDKQHLTQIRDEATYQVGDKILTGKEVRTAILHAQDSILSSEVHNEVNVYAPKINGVVAKVDSIEEVPQYVIDYAQEHDLPLYILGS